MEDKETQEAPVTKSDVAQEEERILEFWNQNAVFKKTLEKDAPNGNFVFYDGPPFATGLPHYGHILAGTMKDVIPRYQTMRGKRVLRRWGWDCHGLPIENLIEKELGLQSKKDIEVYGVEKFNKAAREVVFRYVDEWKKIIPRVGRWVDMENDYRTMDPTYTESVWWAFKTLHQKNLVYKSFKSMHLCPHCETTLSNFEVNQGYKDITDISVYVKFALTDEPNTFVIAWTTTPWTLPGNVALAVNKETVYVKARKDDAVYIVARDLAEKVLKENFEITEEFPGSALIGKSYLPVFNYYQTDSLENRQNGWKIYHGDFVTTESGTGIVHIAPAFGEDDLNLGTKEHVPFVQHVSTDGVFKPEVTDFAGQKVKPIEDPQKADVEVIKYLAKQGTLFAKEKIVHSYPHCWRCGTPLLNYATTSWFVKVTDLKDRLVELNKNVSWTPAEIGEGRFGKWLEGARDWAISRSRYWGAPLPVWENKKGEQTIIGSIAELKDAIGRRNHYFLMRHGESAANANGDLISSKNTEDNPLTENGRAEAAAAAETLKGEHIDVIFSSPFLRTRQTAQIVAEKIGYDAAQIKFDERLDEINAGDFDGSSWEQFLKNFNSVSEKFTKSVGGSETWNSARARMLAFMYDIDAQYEGKKILVVGHGGPLNLLQLSSKGFAVRDIIKHYYDDAIYNAEVMHCDFVALPHNETYEIDLHRPYIDTVVVRDAQGEVLRRVPEVFDTWYDSGSMPFAQAHYPFEHKDAFEKMNSPLFPADFIAEGLDQTRGWFYTLLVMSTGLFDQAPYRHVIVNGLVLAEDGRKMSKSLKNYPDLMHIVNRYGADAMRYYLVSNPIVRGEDLNFSEKGVDEIYKKIVLRLKNVVSFFEMHAPDPGAVSADIKLNVLDVWILSRLREVHDTMTRSLDRYELDRAARPIFDFIDDLSTWYIRRSRDRFKTDDRASRDAALHTTGVVLLNLSKIIAPFMPFVAEEVYQKVKAMDVHGGAESVHLTEWPTFDAHDIRSNPDIDAAMKAVRESVSVALELRQKAGIKVRQPLASLSLPTEFPAELAEIIADEVNVKEIKVTPNEPAALDTVITDTLRAEGLAREIIRAIQDGRKKEGFNPGDTVTVVVKAEPEMREVIAAYQDMITGPTGVTSLSYSDDVQSIDAPIDGQAFSFSLKR